MTKRKDGILPGGNERNRDKRYTEKKEGIRDKKASVGSKCLTIRVLHERIEIVSGEKKKRRRGGEYTRRPYLC